MTYSYIFPLFECFLSTAILCPSKFSTDEKFFRDHGSFSDFKETYYFNVVWLLTAYCKNSLLQMMCRWLIDPMSWHPFGDQKIYFSFRLVKSIPGNIIFCHSKSEWLDLLAGSPSAPLLATIIKN